MKNLDKIRKAIKFYKEAYDKTKREKGVIYCGSPYSVKISGDISAQSSGKLACGIDANVNGEFSVIEPETQELLKADIGLENIISFSVTVSAGDVAQAEIKTFDGDWVHCPVSSFKVTFDDIGASEFNVPKLRNESEEVTKEK